MRIFITPYIELSEKQIKEFLFQHFPSIAGCNFDEVSRIYPQEDYEVSRIYPQEKYEVNTMLDYCTKSRIYCQPIEIEEDFDKIDEWKQNIRQQIKHQEALLHTFADNVSFEFAYHLEFHV